MGPDSPEQHLSVAHIMPWTAIGGVENATLRIANAVKGFGVRNVAFCPPHADVTQLFQKHGFTTVEYELPTHSFRHGAAFYKASSRLAKQFHEHGIDVVHCSDLIAGQQSAIAGKLARLAVLCMIRNRYDSISFRDKAFMLPVDKFAFVSKDSWRKFAYQVSDKRGVVIYDGFDPPRLDRLPPSDQVRSQFNLAPDDLVVGMVARIAPQKDHETFLKAANILLESRPHLRFLIVGDHSGEQTYREHYEKLRASIAGSAVERAAIFTGHRTDIPALMASMDIFVLSTHQEGLPLVLLEAMSLGKPIVATRVDGIPEAIEDGQSGALTPPQDENALAREILALADSREKRESWGQRAKEIVATKFSEAQFAHSLRDLYAGFAGAKAASLYR